MLETQQQVDAGNGESFTTQTSWSPYSPIAPVNRFDEILEIEVPGIEMEDLNHWMFDRVFGVGNSISVEKYLKRDHELLKEDLDNALVNKDELQFLNWLYLILLGKGEHDKQMVCQMPEDIIRSFSLEEEYAECKSSNLFIREAQFSISPIHTNIMHIDQIEKDPRYSSTPIYSLKCLALWILLALKEIKAHRGTPLCVEDMSQPSTVKFTLYDISVVYDQTQVAYWNFPACGLERSGYLSEGRKYQLNLQMLPGEQFRADILTIACDLISFHWDECLKDFIKRNQ